MFYNFVIICLRIFFTLCCPVRSRGKEKLPEGACVLCPNHTALRDPFYVALAGGIKHKMAFMAKEELTRNKIVAAFLRGVGAFPVKRNTGDISAIRASVNAIKSGRKLVMFPEGTRVKEGQEHDAKAGAVMIASLAKVPVVPVYIHNASKWFRCVTVVFGEPVEIVIKSKKTASEEYKEIASHIMSEVERMKREYK
jgi:1-acyl-sn-glycerol-3-phosphate acyltransferase